MNDADLRTLLAKLKAENAAEASATLADIDPYMLLSASGQQEVAAATSVSQQIIGRLVSHAPEDDALVALYLPQDGFDDPHSTFDVEFDGDELEGTTAPNESARFQVGRESPPTSFYAPSRMNQDGEVVSRMAGSRFQTVPRSTFANRPAPAPTPTPEAPKAPAVSKYTLLKRDPFS